MEVLEKKSDMAYEYMNEISQYISELEKNLEDYKTELAQAIKCATSDFDDRLIELEEKGEK